MSSENSHFDAIVIGSGLGSLTCASLLAQIWHKKVLVLEKHFKAGGFTHIFRRNKENSYEWDVGLHYVGEMARGTPPRAIIDYITAGKVRWQKMPDPYDVFIYPDLRVSLSAGEERFIEELSRLFPAEHPAIKQYVSDIKKTSGWFGRGLTSRNLPAALYPLGKLISLPGRHLALMTTGEYLKKKFRDEKLRAVLASQWGDYGLPPSHSAFLTHAMIAAHYLQGAYYPSGGAKTIADAVIPLIEEKGGRVLVSHGVEEILISNGGAKGVRAVHYQKGASKEKYEFSANAIISGIGALNTFTRLLPADYPLTFRRELNDFPLSPANVTVYLGLKDDPRTIGYQGENLWIYDSYDHDDIYARRNRLHQGQISSAFVSCPSLKNPLAKAHAMELIAFMDYLPFTHWADQPWKNRGQDYQNLKEHIMDAMLDFVEPHLPGLRDLVDYRELSTPLSTEYFTGHRSGSIYGLAAIPEKYTRKWLKIRTPVKDLYMTGADVGMHGIVGSMMNGVMTAGMITGAPGSLMKIFKTAFRFSNGLDDETISGD